MAASVTLHLVDGRGLDDARIDALASWLSAAEGARCQRFVRAERRRQFIIGRSLVRAALGKLLDLPPQQLLIEDRPGAAPVLSGVHAPAFFSISHSGPWVACAVSGDTPVGLDIEQLDPTRNILALTEQAFGQERGAWLSARPPATRLRDFYTMWSEHEARIKLGGEPAVTLDIFHEALSIVLCSSREIEFHREIHFRSELELPGFLPEFSG